MFYLVLYNYNVKYICGFLLEINVVLYDMKIFIVCNNFFNEI